MPPQKVVLNLDTPAAAVVTKRKRRTNGPLTGRGGAQGPGSRKRRREPTPDNDRSEDSADKTIKPEIKKEDERQKRPKFEKTKKPKFIVIWGIDPGMSGSGKFIDHSEHAMSLTQPGMSFASTKTSPSSVTAEMSWPGNDGGKSEKVPSVVALIEDNPGNDDFDHNEHRSFFGFEVPEGAVARSHYKATLDINARPSQFDDAVLREDLAGKLVRIEDPQRNSEAMIIALKHILKFSITRAQEELGDACEDVLFKYVFTYPAACSPQGIDALRRAVGSAGFPDHDNNRPEFLSEAHAAAIAAFTSCKSQHGSVAWSKYFPRTALVTVIDVGALTVDLTTVRIDANDPDLSLSEATVPSGGKCGTSAIHCRLMKLFSDKFGPAFSDLPETDLNRNSEFFRSCEKHLRLFDGSKLSKRFRINLRLVGEGEHEGYDAETGHVWLTGFEIKGAIDANLSCLKNLLRDQWQQRKKYDTDRYREETVHTTMLCGGGSLIPYIKQEVEKFCNAHNVRFLRARNPESTVCRGAVISQLRQEMLGTRLSRASFGIEVRKHDENYIHWFLNKGESVDTTKAALLKEINGHIILTYAELLDRDASFEMPILMHEKDGENPDSVAHPDVQRISTINLEPNKMTEYLRRLLRREQDDPTHQATHLAVDVSVEVDRSGRLFFEAKQGACRVGKGELRLDDTVQTN